MKLRILKFNIVECALDLASDFEVSLGLPIARPKSAVVANSQALAWEIQSALGPLGGPKKLAADAVKLALAKAKRACVESSCPRQLEEAQASLAQAKAKASALAKSPFSVRNLGVDFSAGKSSKRPRQLTKNARHRAMQTRAKRMCCLLKASRRLAAKVFISGVLPSLLYDAPILGLFGNPCRKARAKAATFLGLKGPHRDRALAFALRPDVDPQVLALGALVRRFAKEVWLASEKPEFRDPQGLKFGTLAVGISKFLKSCSGPSASPSGPLEAFHAATAQAGWTLKGPFTLVRCNGIALDMSKVCPQRVAKAFKADLVSSNVKGAMSRLHDRIYNDETDALSQNGVCLEPLVSLAGSRDRKTSALVNKFMSNGFITNLKLCNMGYDVDPACQLCGEALDTVYHRLYVCVHTHKRAEINLGSKLLGQALESGSDSLLFTRGLAPMPKLDAPDEKTKVRYATSLRTLGSRQMAERYTLMDHALTRCTSPSPGRASAFARSETMAPSYMVYTATSPGGFPKPHFRPRPVLWWWLTSSPKERSQPLTAR